MNIIIFVFTMNMVPRFSMIETNSYPDYYKADYFISDVSPLNRLLRLVSVIYPFINELKSQL